MDTSHEVVLGDARSLAPDGQIDLVVTSPPYPMIEMWDSAFERMNPAIAAALDRGEGVRAFELMHAELDAVWDRLSIVIREGGIVAVNVGDATRSLDDFQLYPNHARITRAFLDRGFQPLPPVLWHKPTNRATKFMGSGMLPPNAYVTLEHEFVLLFRRGTARSLEPNADNRYESAYFWEERNRWFSDRWTVNGEDQAVEEGERARSGAFPLEIPYRLINMFSVHGDTVLDPFWGTGTTTVAAMLAGRNSMGWEVDHDLVHAFDERLDGITDRSRERGHERLRRHREFVETERAEGRAFDYEAEHYDVPVRTKQERGIRLYSVDEVTGEMDEDRGRWIAAHEPIDP